MRTKYFDLIIGKTGSTSWLYIRIRLGNHVWAYRQ